MNRQLLQRWFWVPSIVLALGLLSIILLVWINRIDNEQQRHLARSDAILDMQFRLALSHLWLEEGIAGEPSVDMKKVWEDMDHAIMISQALLDGGTSEHGMFFDPISRPHLRARVVEVRSLLDQFKQIAVDRLREPEKAGIGTPLDEDFDAVFKAVIDRTAVLQAASRRDLLGRQVRSKQLFIGILAIWIVIVILAVAGFWKRELQKKVAEEALREARDQLERRVEERTQELTTANEQLKREVIERRRAEEDLRVSESKFRRLYSEFHILLDAIPDRLTLLSPDMRILWANKGAVDAAGIDVVTLTGKTCHEVWHGLDAPCNDCPVKKSFTSGGPESAEVVTSNEEFWNVRAYPIRNEEGKAVNVIEMITDITERIAFQTEAMRTAHLASLGKLAAGVAHEVNNPINGVINYAQILSNKSRQGTEQNDIANRIIKEGMRIARIVSGLLSFARERKEERALVHVDEILKDSLVLTESLIKKQGIQVSVDLPPDLPRIIANPQQIQQVFLNIISNARYALNEKYPHFHEDKILEIHGKEAVLDGRACLNIAFRDHGCGIPADIMDKIMLPFFSNKPAGKGTGLGLSISHGIVNDHGGKLMVQSSTGDWTEVVVTLPAKD